MCVKELIGRVSSVDFHADRISRRITGRLLRRSERSQSRRRIENLLVVSNGRKHLSHRVAIISSPSKRDRVSVILDRHAPLLQRERSVNFPLATSHCLASNGVHVRRSSSCCGSRQSPDLTNRRHGRFVARQHSLPGLLFRLVGVRL